MSSENHLVVLVVLVVFCSINFVCAVRVNVEKNNVTRVDNNNVTRVDNNNDEAVDFIKGKFRFWNKYGFLEKNAYALLTIGSATGGVSFRWNYTKNCMHIEGKIENLTPGLHGFHIHELGDLRGGCKSTAGHYNPDKVNHAGPTDTSRHVGDLGNIEADCNGIALIDKCYDFVHTVGEQSILGRAIVVHAKADDLGKVDNDGSRATGNAGGRVGCGIIGLTR